MKPLIPRISKNNDNGQNILPASQSVPRSTVPPPNLQQSNVAQPIATDDARLCYYHQRFGDKARSCRDPCAYALNRSASTRVATFASGEPNETRYDCAEVTRPKIFPCRLLYVADKRNKCNYMIDTGAAVSVLPRSCANRTAANDSLPLVVANNSTITASIHVNEQLMWD